MKRNVIIVFFVFSANIFSFSQNSNLSIELKIKERVKKNLHAFYMKNVHLVKMERGVIRSEDDKDFFKFPPANEWDYSSFKLKKIQLVFKGYTFYEILISPCIYAEKEKKCYDSISDRIFFGSSKKILIGVHNDDIVFFSGELFHTEYALDIITSDESIESYSNYLELKLYSDEVKQLSFVKKTKKWIYFSGVIDVFTSPTKVYYKVLRKDPDKVCYLGWKISGKYKDKEKIQLY